MWYALMRSHNSWLSLSVSVCLCLCLCLSLSLSLKVCYSCCVPHLSHSVYKRTMFKCVFAAVFVCVCVFHIPKLGALKPKLGAFETGNPDRPNPHTNSHVPYTSEGTHTHARTKTCSPPFQQSRTFVPRQDIS